MSEELVIAHCSPTLAGIKTGNLFSVSCDEPEGLYDDIRKFNKILTPKGMRVIPIFCKGERMLIYIYRPEKLRVDFKDKEAREMLKHYDYPYDNPDRCVVCLAKKIKNAGSFPHEVGLFLGYPPEDVKGFIDNQAQNFKCIGTWKVYGDQPSATRKFEQFKLCTEIYCKGWHCGMTLEQLAVAL